MRRLWQDIDQSRDKLGLGNGSASEGPVLTWDVWLAWASGLVEDAGAQMSAVPNQVRTVVERLPGIGACQAVSAGAFARKLPLVGTLMALVSDRSDD